MNSITFISEIAINENNAGNKARIDVENILKSEFGNSEYGYRDRKFENLFQKIEYILNIHIWKNLIRLYHIKNKKIFIQYPFYWSNFLLRSVLRDVIAKNTTVVIVHDLVCLHKGAMSTDKEIELLNDSRACIVHNKKMADFLYANGIKVPMIILECFDYLRKNDNHLTRNLEEKIAFAGNLDKSTFIQQLGELSGTFYLYGPNKNDLSKIDNITYCGSYSPDVIPEKLQGSFGLIWDGDSIKTCSGMYGEYTKYNNPHKLSLYIASCLPVIAWEEAAVADFVKKEKIGFCVKNLYEIQSKISSIDKDEYQLYISNILNLNKKVTKGYFLKAAINKTVESLL